MTLNPVPACQVLAQAVGIDSNTLPRSDSFLHPTVRTRERRKRGTGGGPAIGSGNRVVGVRVTGSDFLQEGREAKDQSMR